MDGRWEIGEIDGVHVVRRDLVDVMWQKERMLNVLIDELPVEYDKVAWLDADIFFDNENWIAETSELLRRVPVAQLFERAIWLDAEDRPGTWAMHEGAPGGRYRDAYVRHMLLGRQISFNVCHPGFAWAARRETITSVGGLFDQHILGSGDTVMALGFSGKPVHSYYERLPDLVMDSVYRWTRAAGRETRGCVGFLSGTIRHMWHGERQNRQYVSRQAILTENGFSQAESIEIGPDGLWRWTPQASPSLRHAVEQYFVDRREDE